MTVETKLMIKHWLPVFYPLIIGIAIALVIALFTGCTFGPDGGLRIDLPVIEVGPNGETTVEVEGQHVDVTRNWEFRVVRGLPDNPEPEVNYIDIDGDQTGYWDEEAEEWVILYSW